MVERIKVLVAKVGEDKARLGATPATGISAVPLPEDPQQMIELLEAMKTEVLVLDLDGGPRQARRTIQAIMEKAPLPIIVVSDIPAYGPEAVIEALSAGALEFLDRSALESRGAVREAALSLRNQLRQVGRLSPLTRRFRVRRVTGRTGRPSRGRRRESKIVLVTVGASLGGPAALQELLLGLPGELPAGYLVVQHMPAVFSRALALRLDTLCELDVSEARDGEYLTAGRVLIAPGGKQLLVDRYRKIRLHAAAPDARYVPSIDITFLAAAESFRSEAIGVLLTGMGKDGVLGLRRIAEAGGVTMVQNEESAAVFGMGRAAVEMGCAQKVVPLEELPGLIASAVRRIAAQWTRSEE